MLQNLSTREITVFKVTDIDQHNPARLCVTFVVPLWLCAGDYKLFLIAPRGWGPGEIRTDNPKLTERYADKSVIKTKDGILVVSGKLVVTRWFKARMSIDGEPINISSTEILASQQSDDTCPEGEYITYADILYTDILRVEGDSREYHEPTHTEKRKYTEYKRNE